MSSVSAQAISNSHLMSNSRSNAPTIKRRVTRESLFTSNTNASTSNTNIPSIITESASEAAEVLDTPGWGHKVISYVEDHSLILENKANAARDQMANERTFLSWMRTGLVLVTVGVAFMQMYSIQTRARVAIYNGTEYDMAGDAPLDSLVGLGKPLGYLTGIFAILVLIFGLVRFFSTQYMLQQRKFPATRVMAAMLLIFTLVVLVLILAIEIKSS